MKSIILRKTLYQKLKLKRVAIHDKVAAILLQNVNA